MPLFFTFEICFSLLFSQVYETNQNPLFTDSLTASPTLKIEKKRLYGEWLF